MKRIIALGLFFAANISGLPINDIHFYRAQPFFGEPRFEKPWLGTFEFTVGTGATDHARNDCNQKTCLLNIYGPQNMHLVGQGVPKSTTDPIDIILTNLARVPAQNSFGQLVYQGHFHFVETTFSYIQNFNRGFFAGIFFPYISLSIGDICYRDCTPHGEACPNVDTPAWQAFLNVFDDMLAKYNLYTGPVKNKGIGDTSIYVGWTMNYQDTEVIDYVDVSFCAGILIPTAAEKNENNVFEIPLGYDGHTGIDISGSGSVGTYDWLTVGGQMEALIFFHKKHDIHMKTDINQSGFIKLAHGEVDIHKGAVWRLGAYARADHLARGLSLLVGYSYSQKNRDQLSPCNQSLFNISVVNSDPMYKGWNMHTIHFGADYDFTKESMRIGPRLGMFYNLQFGGKRTFDANYAGGPLWFDVAFVF